MHKRLFITLLGFIILLAGCDYSKEENQTGIFYNVFVKSMDGFLHFLGRVFQDNYGFAIISIVLIVRFILLPFMLIQVKNMHMMREKTKVVQPELDAIRDKMKHATSQEERNAANQLLMKKYQSYGINPLKNMLGCLPVLIQMPILMGLYMSLKYPSSHGITEYPHFLWFDLTQPDLIMTIIAAIKRSKKNILLYDGIFTDIHNICVSTFCCSFGLILEYKRCFSNSANAFCSLSL